MKSSWWQQRLRTRHPSLVGIPGPSPTVGLGNLFDLLKHKPGTLSTRIEAKYGPFALYWAGPEPILWLHDPATIEEVLDSRASSFYKDEPTGAMLPVLAGPNAFVSNGVQWQNVREQNFLAQEGADEWIEESYQSASHFVRERIAKDLSVGRLENFDRWLFRLVFDFTSFQLLGRTLDDTAFSAFLRVMDAIDWRMRTNLPVLAPGFAAAKKVWVQAVSKAFEAAKSEAHGVSLAHRLAPHSRLLIAQQAGTIANLYPGGVFSVTATLLRLLGRNAALDPLRQSLDHRCVSYRELAANSILEQFVRESMCVEPPVPVFMRRVRSLPVKLEAIALDPKVRVIIGIAGVHRSTKYWADSDAFRPERWTQAVLQANPFGSGRFFPFGRGPRACQGQALGLFQIRVLLDALLGAQARRLNLHEPSSIKFYWGCDLPSGVRAEVS